MKKPTIHTSRVHGGTASPEEIAWNKYSRDIMRRLGLGCNIIANGNTTHSIYNDKTGRFSKDYETSEEFYSDMELAAKYLANYKKVPEELLYKLERTVNENREKH